MTTKELLLSNKQLSILEDLLDEEIYVKVKTLGISEYEQAELEELRKAIRDAY